MVGVHRHFNGQPVKFHDAGQWPARHKVQRTKRRFAPHAFKTLREGFASIEQQTRARPGAVTQIGRKKGSITTQRDALLMTTGEGRKNSV